MVLFTKEYLPISVRWPETADDERDIDRNALIVTVGHIKEHG
jgi:hypothetical protein